MGKYDSCIIRKILFSRLYYYLSLWSIHRIYDTALFKIYDSTAVDSNDDGDEMDYLPESSGGEAEW